MKRKLFNYSFVLLLTGILSGCGCSDTPPKSDDFIIDSSIKIETGASEFIYKFKDNEYEFGFSQLIISNGSLNFLSNGYLETHTALDGLKRVTISGTGSYQISYGYEPTKYDFTSKKFTDDHTYLFNNDSPSYFKIKFDNDSKIKSLKVEFSSSKADNPFKKIPSIGEVPMEGHTYRTKETVDFPSFPVSEGLSYHLSDDGTYYIVDNFYDNLVVDGVTNRVVFPSTYNNLPVKRIGFHGFSEREWIHEVYIPESITMIENETFSMCGLKKVYWDASICEDFPARNAIFHPVNSQNIDLVFGPHVKHIPARMMLPSLMTPNIHSNIRSISFADECKVESIGEYAFYGQSLLNRIDLPASIKSIGDYAFYGWGLTELELENVISIGNSAFRFNEQLENVKLPNSLNNIGESIFEGCSKLKEIDLKNTLLTNIPFAAFKDSGIKHVSLPNGLLSIGESTFENCNNLNELILPISTTSIGVKSFSLCSKLTFVELNKKLVSIGNESFYGCTSLLTLVIKSESIDDFELNNKVFVECGNIGIDVYISEDVTYLPNNMFYGTSLQTRLPLIKNIYFYHSLTVGDNAFYGLDDVDVTYYGFNSDIINFVIGENNDILDNIQGRE